jgi:hypothetical protein
MFCIHCGAPNPEASSFCSTCGKGIGAPTKPPAPARETSPPITVPAPLTPQPQARSTPTAEGKGKPVVWILAGFAACLLIMITVSLGLRLSRVSSGPGPTPDTAVPDPPPTAAPATYTPPATAPATDNRPAPTSSPVQPPPSAPPAAPQNPIVGDWKATTFIGSTMSLHLGADGRYVMNPGSDEGVYSYSSGDGTLRLQSNSFFSKGIMVWSCQVSGDSLSCVDPNGAGHVYARQ